MISRRRRHRLAHWVLPTGAVAAFLASAAFGPEASASGTWTVTTHGSAVALAALMPMGKTPTVTMLPASVQLDWAPATLPSGREVSGYVLNRQQTGTSAVVQVCSVMPPFRTCQDSPPAGQPVVYSVVPTEQLWRGAASAPSTPVTLPAPALALATPAASALPPAIPSPSPTASPSPTPTPVPTPPAAPSPTLSPTATPTPSPSHS